ALQSASRVRGMAHRGLADVLACLGPARLGGIHDSLGRTVVEIEPESAAAVRRRLLFERDLSQVQTERVMLDVEGALRPRLARRWLVEVVAVVRVDKARHLRVPEKRENGGITALSRGCLRSITRARIDRCRQIQ